MFLAVSTAHWAKNRSHPPTCLPQPKNPVPFREITPNGAPDQ